MRRGGRGVRQERGKRRKEGEKEERKRGSALDMGNLFGRLDLGWLGRWRNNRR